MKNKQKEWHPATKPLTSFLGNLLATFSNLSIKRYRLFVKSTPMLLSVHWFGGCRDCPYLTWGVTALHPERLERGGPLLTVETEMNGDAKRTNERVPFLVGSLDLSCRHKRFFFCLGCSSRPSTKYFFLNVHYFNSFVPLAQQAGQAAVLGRLSLSVCLCLHLMALFTLSCYYAKQLLLYDNV